MVQPVVSNPNNMIGANCEVNCGNKKQHQKNSSEKKDCNPFLACALTAWLQVPKIYLEPSIRIFSKQEYFTLNDNRIIKNLSSLFHPPNLV